MATLDLSSPNWLATLDSLLATQTYLHGFEPTSEDLALLAAVGTEPAAHKNVARYFRHLNALPAHQKNSWPTPATAMLKGSPSKVQPIVMASAPELCDGKREDPASAVPDFVPDTMKKKDVGQKSGVTTLPFDAYKQHRLDMWDKLKAKAPPLPNHGEKITIVCNGKTIEGEAGVTKPINIAKECFDKKDLATFVVAKFDSSVPSDWSKSLNYSDQGTGSQEKKLWDMQRPLEFGGTLGFLKFDDEEAEEVFWHSSAHIMGEALERKFGGHLTKGPPGRDGFFYDIYLGEQTIGESHYADINAAMKKVVKEKQPFERLIISKEDGLELFKFNPFKLEILHNHINDGEHFSVYRCGDLIDPCRGPHVANTSMIKDITVTKNSAAYWEGKSGQDSLQRVYGISFPDKDKMKEWKHLQEEAKKRDHREIGVKQELFFFSVLSAGSCFWLPHGTRLYTKLIDMIKQEYWKRGFMEVVTPNMYNMKLWETSGHAAKYKENMFTFKVEGQEFAMKPMNCPGHCVMFNHRVRSWRELPMRVADFGVLHRNELSGALHGLTRVRRFQQDDAHIFCRQSQIKDEIKGALDFLNCIYEHFGFTYTVRLSTRPEQYLGELETWNQAEAEMEASLNESGLAWELNPGDGAFYGPKIDITLVDALKRELQCGTIQLDFQLPIRFDLTYNAGEDADGKPVTERPVIIHRAILGSVERFIGVLTEHLAGKWPFWLSPRQICVIPVAPTFNDYCEKVATTLHDNGYHADAEVSTKKMAKKIREAEMAQYNFVLVVGEKDIEQGGVTVRSCKVKNDKGRPIEVFKTNEECLAYFNELRDTKNKEY